MQEKSNRDKVLESFLKNSTILLRKTFLFTHIYVHKNLFSYEFL